MTDKGIDNPRFGIIEQAAIDYVNLLTDFKSPTTDCNVNECRRFFRSQWFHSLCDLDPEQVINRLERKAKTMVMKYEVHKEESIAYSSEDEWSGLQRLHESSQKGWYEL